MGRRIVRDPTQEVEVVDEAEGFDGEKSGDVRIADRQEVVAVLLLPAERQVRRAAVDDGVVPVEAAHHELVVDDARTDTASAAVAAEWFLSTTGRWAEPYFDPDDISWTGSSSGDREHAERRPPAPERSEPEPRPAYLHYRVDPAIR